MNRRGFTLLEILVALAVFAVIAMTVYGRIGDLLMQTGSLEDRTFATWIARNTLTRLEIEQAPGDAVGVGRVVESVTMADRNWEVVTEISTTSEAGLRRVEISVSHGGPAQQGGAVARLTGFLGQH